MSENAASCSSFQRNLRLTLCLGHFLKGEGMNKKKENVILLQLSRVIKDPKVFGSTPQRFGVKSGQSVGGIFCGNLRDFKYRV